MAITNSYIASTATTNIFTAVGEQAVTTIFFCNVTTGTDVTVNIWVTSQGQAVGNDCLIINNLPLQASETYVFETEKLILDDSEAIHAKATANNAVVATISSVQVS
jgi:hypothetical protein